MKTFVAAVCAATAMAAVTPASAAEPDGCAAGSPKAFSVSNPFFGTDGQPTIIPYPDIQYRVGNLWDARGGRLRARCAGLYQLTVSYTSDSAYECPEGSGHVGTLDDIYVVFIRTTPPNYDDPSRIGEEHGAYRGQLGTSDPAARGAASYTLYWHLEAGDAVQTRVSTDGDVPACLRPVNFSAARIAP